MSTQVFCSLLACYFHFPLQFSVNSKISTGLYYRAWTTVNTQPYILVHTLPPSLYMHTQNDLLKKENLITPVSFIFILKEVRQIKKTELDSYNTC